jgi:endonuclease I
MRSKVHAVLFSLLVALSLHGCKSVPRTTPSPATDAVDSTSETQSAQETNSGRTVDNLTADAAAVVSDERIDLADADDLVEDRSLTRARPINWASGNYNGLANRHLAGIYVGVEPDFYCGCDLDFDAERIPKLKVVEGSCDPGGPSYANRAPNGEWEHVVPASWIASAEGCSSRKECSTAGYKAATSDPFGLVPANGRLNAVRDDNDYADLDDNSEVSEEGACDFKVVRYANGTYVDPPGRVEGDLARITLYLLDRHGYAVDPDYVELMKKWSAEDPIDATERRRIRSIKALVNWDESPLDYAQ